MTEKVPGDKQRIMADDQPIKMAYCTNVHAGADLEGTIANLQRHALAVKQRAFPDRPMGIGLWLSAVAARQLINEKRTVELAEWLNDRGLVPITMNGFPYGDFHEPIVKHRVYQPNWCDPARMDYTRDLIEILDAILPKGLEGSISTLPIAWPTPSFDESQLELAAKKLRGLADEMHELEQNTGRLIYLCLEPEPGCVLQRCDDVVRFFREHLRNRGDFERIQRHIRVCHDICHTAVMFEDQADVLQRYASEGIHVGKVQVSSAIELDFSQIDIGQRADALEQLSTFAEDRYLHQTVVRMPVTDELRFHDDLPLALAKADAWSRQDTLWRTHFHVPIYLDRFGALNTTRQEILKCLDAAKCQPQLRHFEVETYAWGVLPDRLRQSELAIGIADEMLWLARQLENQNL